MVRKFEFASTIEIKKQEDQMTPEIKTINFGGINCYLVKTDSCSAAT